MLLGLVFHGGLTYAYPSNAIWIVSDWRRGVRGFLWNRFVRIVCPFFLFYPFLLVAYVVAVIIAYAPETLPPIMAVNKAGPPPEQTLNTMHMWFLYYLAIFSVIVAVLANIKIAAWDRLADWFYGSFWPTLFAPLAMVPALWIAGAPTGSTESFIPLPWVFGFYGLFFAAGWKLWGRESYLDIVGRYVWALIPISAALFAAYYYLMPNLSSVRANPESLLALPLERQLTMAFLSAYLSVFLTLITLVLGKKFLSGHSHTLKYISDASYWIYLVHLPLMLAIQGLMAPFHWNVWIKFATSVAATFVISLGLYAIFVRYTPIGWLLNGYKPFPWHLL
jgi:glucans biosynthesis protein C